MEPSVELVKVELIANLFLSSGSNSYLVFTSVCHFLRKALQDWNVQQK